MIFLTEFAPPPKLINCKKIYFSIENFKYRKILVTQAKKKKLKENFNEVNKFKYNKESKIE